MDVALEAAQIVHDKEHKRQVDAAVFILECIKQQEYQISLLKANLVKVEKGDLQTIALYDFIHPSAAPQCATNLPRY